MTAPPSSLFFFFYLQADMAETLASNHYSDPWRVLEQGVKNSGGL